MILSKKQSALVLEQREEGEITVNVVSGDYDGLTAAICLAIAKKMLTDDKFREEIMYMMDEDV